MEAVRHPNIVMFLGVFIIIYRQSPPIQITASFFSIAQEAPSGLIFKTKTIIFPGNSAEDCQSK